MIVTYFRFVLFCFVSHLFIPFPKENIALGISHRASLLIGVTKTEKDGHITDRECASKLGR